MGMSGKFHYRLWEMTARLLHIAAPVKHFLIVSTMASIVGNLSQMGLMGFGAMTFLSASGRLAECTHGSAFVYGICAFVSAVMIAVCRYMEGFFSHAGAYSLLAGMRVHLFETIRRLAPACLIDREKGDLMNIAVSDIETIEFFFAHTIGPLFTVILLPGATLVLAFLIHPLYVLVLLPLYLLVSVVFPLIGIRVGRLAGLRYRERLGKLKSLVLESVYGIRDIQIFGYGEKRLKTVRAQNQRVNESSHFITLHKQAISSAPSFVIYVARISILAVASWLAASGLADSGLLTEEGGFLSGGSGVVLLSFVAAASFSSTQSLTTVVSSLLETYAAAERLFILEDTKPEVTEAVVPKHLDRIQEIVFDHVCFSYPGTSEKVLDDFCLSASGTDKIGIVGESGAGKSTILRLLLRFWNPVSGQILINQIPVNEFSLEDLHRRIAVLEQDTFLFDASIAENIALGKPEASQEEIMAAAKRAGIHDWITSLPDGYDTLMGEMGNRLSGGEKQRIGIARTLIAEPDVIVMDEPTSSLDVLHEKELLRTLEECCSDQMIFIVSHRPSTLIGCSRILHVKK